MNDTKPWYLSRTVWASLVAVLSAVASLVGLPIDGSDAAALADMLLEAVTAVSGLVAIASRLSATSRLS